LAEVERASVERAKVEMAEFKKFSVKKTEVKRAKVGNAEVKGPRLRVPRGGRKRRSQSLGLRKDKEGTEVLSAEVEQAKVTRAVGLRSRGSMLAGQMSTGMRSFEPRSARLTSMLIFSVSTQTIQKCCESKHLFRKMRFVMTYIRRQNSDLNKKIRVHIFYIKKLLQKIIPLFLQSSTGTP
jgi:hypothetical protein